MDNIWKVGSKVRATKDVNIGKHVIGLYGYILHSDEHDVLVEFEKNIGYHNGYGEYGHLKKFKELTTNCYIFSMNYYNGTDMIPLSRRLEIIDSYVVDLL